jgi:hypothetical protein
MRSEFYEDDRARRQAESARGSRSRHAAISRSAGLSVRGQLLTGSKPNPAGRARPPEVLDASVATVARSRSQNGGRMNDGAKSYRVIDTDRRPSGTVWWLVRQESEDVADLVYISWHGTLAGAEAARADMERWDMDRAAGLRGEAG